ncbi:oligosaccharide flippase family protein [Microbacterium sp.]|uniref:oligosaccharide flippase family protein n=1 Tax=Microbacterium sp. TaxID=51671 RepID=UPI003A8637BE
MRSPAAPRSGLLAGSAVLGLATIVVSAGNWLLHVVLTRLLTPAQFGDATLAMTVVLLAALVAATLQLAASKAVATHPEAIDGIRRLLVRSAWICGGVIAVGMSATAAALSAALSVSTPWMFVVLGAGLPVYFVQAVERGVALGDVRYLRLAASYVAEAVARLAAVLALTVAGAGPVGVAVGIAVGFVAAALVARAPRRRDGARRRGPGAAPSWPTLRAALLGSSVLLCAQVLINNADIVVAKARFDPEVAGVYAAGAVAGRLVFFLSWAVVQAAVPQAARSGADDNARRRAFWQATAITAALGLAATGGAVLLGRPLIVAVFGASYAGAADILVPYTAASALFAVTNLWASWDVACGRHRGPIVLLAGAALQVALMVVLGADPVTLANLQVIAMAVTVTVIAVTGRFAGARRKNAIK